MTDAELITRIKSGEIGLFAEVITKYQTKLINFSQRYLADTQDAQDATQETFIKIYKNIHKIDVTRKFSTYLFEIAKHEAINIWRKKHRLVPLPEGLVEDEKIPEIDFNFVRRAVNSLEQKYRRVIKMYYFEERSYRQIAQSLQIPINTVRTYLFRAKAQLKKIIHNE